MHAQTDPQTSPFLSNSAFTCAGSIWLGSSTGISTVSKPHFLNCGKSLVESLVNGEVNKKVLIPNLIGLSREAKDLTATVKARVATTSPLVLFPARSASATSCLVNRVE